MNLRFAKKHVPLGATAAVCCLLYGIAAIAYDNFRSPQVLINFFTDNASLGVAAVGLTFVILSGGIDLSVGSAVGLTSILIAWLVEKHHVQPVVAILVSLSVGAFFGAGMGCLIRYYALPPFLVTLAGMFLIRGLGFVIHFESIAINHSFYNSISNLGFHLGRFANVPLTGILFVIVFLIGVCVAHYTKFGRNIYAMGGSEQSALLMGLPVGSVKVWVYTLNGVCAAFAGVLYTFYTSSGNPTAGTGMELDAIAAVVIGGTLLTGGVGYVAGTLIGVLIFGVIQTAITFQGTLSSWWTKITIGFLLLVFILLQKLIQAKRR